MAKDYVERREGFFYLIGSRVPLSRIIYLFQLGEAPESIQRNYSTLSLEQVYGAIIFYLGNQEEVEKDMAELQRVEEENAKRVPPLPQELREKLERAREQRRHLGTRPAEIGRPKAGGITAMNYVERREGFFYLIGSRVPLSRIIYLFQLGEAPESIRRNYPTLSLEQVYGAISFYLGNKEEVEQDMAELQRVEDEAIKDCPPLPPELQQKLDRAREQMRTREADR